MFNMIVLFWQFCERIAGIMLFVVKKKNGLKLECSELSVSVRLDGLGYWCSYRNSYAFYRRCIDGSVVRGREEPVGLSPDQADKVTLEVLSLLLRVVTSLASDAGVKAAIDQQALELLLYASRLQLKAYCQRSYLADSAYPESIPILPPDRYGDIVIQPAIGCPNGQCSFCAFYQGKRFRVLSEEALKQHVSQVKALLGPGWGGRDGVFLGSANAMALSTRRLLPVLQLICDEVGVIRRGVAAFGDADFAPARQSGDWASLSEHGLRQVVIGLETGDGVLRGQLGKSGDLLPTRRMIEELKMAGIRVGVTILTGVGRHSHVEKTLSYVKHLPLEAKDIVYLSPLEGGGVHVSAPIADQYDELLLGLRSITNAQVVPYQMKRFFYYA